MFFSITKEICVCVINVILCHEEDVYVCNDCSFV